MVGFRNPRCHQRDENAGALPTVATAATPNPRRPRDRTVTNDCLSGAFSTNASNLIAAGDGLASTGPGSRSPIHGAAGGLPRMRGEVATPGGVTARLPTPTAARRVFSCD